MLLGKNWLGISTLAAGFLVAAGTTALADQCKVPASFEDVVAGATQLMTAVGPATPLDAVIDPSPAARYVLANNTCKALAPMYIQALAGGLQSSYHVISMLSRRDSILGSQAGSFVSAVGDAGKLPELLAPMSWNKKSPGQAQSVAEHDAEVAYCFDVAAIVDGLAANVSKDERILARYDEALSTARNLLDETRQREKLGLLPLGSADAFAEQMSQLADDRSALEMVIRQQKHTLEPFLGKNWNYAQVPVLNDLADTSVSHNGTMAFARSLEIKTADDLISASRSGKVQKGSYDWLYPSPKPTNPDFMVEPKPGAPSQSISSLMQARDIIRLGIFQRLSSADQDYRMALATLPDLVKAREGQEHALSHTLLMLRLDAATDPANAGQSLLNLTKAGIEEELETARMSIARAKLLRLYALGPYSDYLTK